MKITKKLICAALSIMMIVSSFATVVMADNAAASTKFSDVANDQIYANAVNTLSIMSIINGYEDGSFKPDQNVTRAEFAAMLMRTLKLGHLGDTSAAGLPFSDIDDNNSDINWAIPNINTCYSMGIINGYDDGTFKPSANVAYEEAVKMIVCTLGYGAGADVSKTPWYVDYMDAATRTGIVKIASKIGTAGTPATRACIAQLLYDSLEVGLIENGMITEKTILSDYLGYKKCKGIIASDGVTSLTAPDVNLRDDEIQIYAYEESTKQYETHTYTTTDSSLKDNLGREVEFYYANNGSALRTLMFCVIQDSSTLTINAANIEPADTENTILAYYEDRDANRTKKASLDANNIVIYNGKLYGSNDATSRFDKSMIPDVGSFTLIDSDNDNKYDIIKIDAYKLYFVSSRSASTYEVVDNVLNNSANNENKITLNKDNDRNLTIVNSGGTEISFSSIAVNNIVAVAESNNNGGIVTRKAVVLADKVTGTVTASNNKGVTIGGKMYYYSNAAPWVNTGISPVETLDRPENQDSGNYYLDMNGDIVAYSKDATSEKTNYGFIKNHSNASAIDEEVVFEIITSNGAVQIGTYSNTKVNGTTCATGQDVVNALKASAITGSRKVQQLIKYSTKASNGKTVFDKIYTAEDKSQGQKIEPDSLTRLSTINKGMSMKYNATSKKLTNVDDSTISININNAMVMCVPDDLSSYSEFRRSTVSNEFKNGKNSFVEVYDVSATGIPEVVVLYGADSSEDVHSLSPVYIFSEMEQAENPSENNAVMTQATGYMVSPSGSSSTFTNWLSKDGASIGDTLKLGDIYRAGTDTDGYMLVKNSNIIYRAGEAITFGIEQDSPSDDMEDADYVLIKGGIAAKDTNNVSIATDNAYTNTIPFSISDFDRAKVLVYSYDNRGDLEVTEVAAGEYESIINGLSSKDTGSIADEVIIYMSRGEIKLLAVLPVQ